MPAPARPTLPRLPGHADSRVLKTPGNSSPGYLVEFRTKASSVMFSMSESPPHTLSIKVSRGTTRPQLRISTSRNRIPCSRQRQPPFSAPDLARALVHRKRAGSQPHGLRNRPLRPTGGCVPAELRRKTASSNSRRSNLAPSASAPVSDRRLTASGWQSQNPSSRAAIRRAG